MAEKRKVEEIVWCAVTFGATFWVVANIVSAVGIYLLDDYDPKFGRYGTFELGARVAAAYAAAGTLICGVALGLCWRRLVRRFSFRRLIAISAGSAVACVMVLVCIYIVFS